MKLLTTIAALAVAFAATAANPIPVDPEVRTGVLPNGLTYYIRHNATPAGLADFFIAQRVGSINELDGQEGLAHFLEHMCFNGTEHFPGNSLISYLESIGVKFGRNLNAYTSTDETVYNICEVPAARFSALDSCVMILGDWSGRLLLTDKDIDEERGVIRGEMRDRSAAANRILTAVAPEIYQGNIYGRRMPIGKAEVVEGFSPDTLRAYYHKWYHPANQAVIIVGDFDTDAMEASVKKHLGALKGSDKAVKATPVAVPDNAAPIAVTGTDPEQTTTMVQLYYKEHELADSEAGTIAQVRNEYIRSLITNMLVERLDAIENTPGCPWTNLGIGDRQFLLSGTRDALMFRATATDADAARSALNIFNTELLRAALHGFTGTELQQAKLTDRARRESDMANAGTETNTQHARRLVKHFTRGDIAASTEQMYKIMKGVERTTTLDDVNAHMAALVRPDGRNRVTVIYASGDDAPELSPSAVLADAAGIDTAAIEPFTDTFANRPLLADAPVAGSIVSETDGPFGTRLLTLSNGIRVYLRHSTETPDEVLVRGVSPGGFSMSYDPAKKGLYKMCDEILAVSGFGGHSSADLRKLLAGHNVKSAVSIGNTTEDIAVSTTPSDLGTAMQLLYLKATSLTPDDNAFGALMASKRSSLERKNVSAAVAMGDSIHSYVFNRHPIGEKLHATDLDGVDFDALARLYAERFGDMSDFTFIITGNFAPDSIRGLVEQYIASLPGAGRKETARDFGYGYIAGENSHVMTYPMGENPTSISYTFYNGECPYDLGHILAAQTFGSIVKSRLLSEVREKLGLTYGINGHCGVTAGFNGPETPSRFIMPVYIKHTPGHEDEVFGIVRSTVDELATAGPTPEELDKVKTFLRKNITENRRANGYWETVIKVYDQYGPDMDSAYESIIDAMTPETVRDFGARYIKGSSHTELSMRPE